MRLDTYAEAHLKKLFALLFAVTVALGASASALPPVTHMAKNVVVLVIDGPRQSEMWEDASRKLIPRLSRELAPRGVLLSKFRNNGPTYTAAGHTAMCTGYYEEKENSSGTDLPLHAGMFQHFLKATGLPKEKAWVIASKDKLVVLANTSEKAWAGQYNPSTWCGVQGGGAGAGYAEDAQTVEIVKTVLKREHPRLMLINLKEPDAGGHSGSWENYTHGLRASDGFAYEIWKFLQADKQYKDKTAFFITHDHGRHLDGVRDGFVNHGDDCEGCRKISLLALGPDFKRGAVLETAAEQIDLPVTIADLLGFPMPGLKGRALKELYK